MYNFKHDGSKFKLQITNERYFVNVTKRTVTVTADVRVVVPDFITRTINEAQLPDGFSPVFIPFFLSDKEVMKMEWTSRCSPDDQWDVNKGKKIALAKLEANAYKRVARSITRWLDEFNNFVVTVNQMSTEFVEKAEGAAEHDERYIYDIA